MSHLNLQKIVSVKGKPGLFHLINYNPKGFFLQPFGGGSAQFFSNEKGKVLAVGNVDLKLKDGSLNSLDIFIRMEKSPTLSTDASSTELVAFFQNIIPDLDEDVAPSHLDKLYKWYHTILEHHQVTGMVNEEDDGLTIA